MSGPDCFEGHAWPDEHRTTGGRAWCSTVSEWCYPNAPCARCLDSEQFAITDDEGDTIAQSLTAYGYCEAVALVAKLRAHVR